jgi:hypothetical protein
MVLLEGSMPFFMSLDVDVLLTSSAMDMICAAVSLVSQLRTL